MSGYKRFAAITLIGTTTLTAVGTGGYYLATGGFGQGAFGFGSNPHADGRQSADSQEPADLDALTSAWARPLPSTQPDAAADYSATARSASATLANADMPAAQVTPDDRYGIYPGLQASIDKPEIGASVEVDPPTNSANATQRTARDAETIEPAGTTAAEPSADSPSDGSTVARGQEPNNDADLAPLAPVDVSGEAEQVLSGRTTDAGATNEIPEPQPLSLPTDKQPKGTSAQRARNAFRDQPASAAADRYGTPIASSAGANESASNSATINPFESKSTTATPSADSLGTVEPLPMINNDGATGIAEPGLAGKGIGSTNDQAARASIDPSANSFRGRAQEPALGRLPDATIGDEPGSPTGGLLTHGMTDSASVDGSGRPGERALEGPQNSTLVIQKFAPGEVQVGKPAKFVVQIRNIGTQTANDVVIRDEVPHGTKLVSTTPHAKADGSQLVWQIGKLSAGEERSLEMQLMPIAEGEIGSVATVSYSAQASVKTRCTMPQLAIRMTSPEKVMIGQEQRVKIELQNPGSGDATGVMLFENVPENVKHAAGPTLEFEIGTLRAGETRELELVLLAEKAGEVVNRLTARAEGNLQVQQEVKFEVIAPGLVIAVNGPERRYLERPATYEVSVENPGTAPAYDVQIVTKLPKGMRFVRANNMGEYDAASHAVYWSLAELPEGESGTVELVAMPTETGQQTLEVEGRAGQGLADQAKRQILVEGLAAIMFEVRDLEDPIEVGGETGYEIRVVNQGTKAATKVRVAVNLPPGMQIVSAEGETKYATQGTALVFEPLPELAAKADTLFRVRVQGTQPGDQRVTVEVSTDDIAQPIRREESTRVFGDE